MALRAIIRKTMYALKGLLRRTLRRILAELSRQALKKHNPEIVAVVGEGKTGISREAIYHALKSEPPVRRNIEAPDAEFVLPLIILGIEEYPRSYFAWLKSLVRSLGQLLLRPAYKHRLVLEISYTNKKIFDYFWDLTHPKVLVVCGEAPYLSENQTSAHVFRVKDDENIKSHLKTAVDVAKAFGIKEAAAQKALAKFSLPQARINIFVSKKGGLIVDATHQYYPPSEKTVDEILEALPGRKIFVTPSSQKQIAGEAIKRGEVGIISGPKKKMWPVILELAKTPWFD